MVLRQKSSSGSKDLVDHLDKPNVVYSIWCQDCQATHVGQTSRQMATWVEEHRKAVTKCDVAASVIAEHVWFEEHQIDWSAATVLESEINLHCQLVLESWHIHRQKHSLNREQGALPLDYTPLLA